MPPSRLLEQRHRAITILHVIRWITKVEENEALKGYLPWNVWLLCYVSIETGCRRSELLKMTKDQLSVVKNDDGSRSCQLHLWETKNDNPRTIPLLPPVEAALRELLDDGIFPTQGELRGAWEKMAAETGLGSDKDFVFHALRHTRATRMVNAKIDIRVIQEWLGHKEIKTTTRYAHVNSSTLFDAMMRVGTSESMAA